MRVWATAVGLTVLILALSGALLRLLWKKRSAVCFGVLTLASGLVGYLLAAAALLWLDWFTVLRALAVEACAMLTGAVVGFAVRRKQGKAFGTIEWEIQADRVPLLLLVVALLLSWGNFGYFGMGQDQGVYQVKAIELMYGATQKVYSFPEYGLLETEEQRYTFNQGVFHKLTGLDNMRASKAEILVIPRLFDKDAELQLETYDDGIFHGIPTFAAMLALFGTLGNGIGQMTGLLTLSYALTVLLVWYSARNLGLKRGASLLAASLFLLSPQVVWGSKSTLTECVLAMLIALFVYLLTEPEEAGRRWWSAFAVAAFCFFHVSIYVVLPMFLVLYWLLYLWTEDRQYLRAAMVTAVSFLLGLTYMQTVSPHYTIANTGRLWHGPVTKLNIWQVLMGCGAAAVVLTALLRLVRRSGERTRQFLSSRAFGWIVRLALAGMLAASALQTALWVRGGEALGSAVTMNGMVVLAWITGLVALPVAILCMFVKPRPFLEDERSASVTFLFLYAVVLMGCLLKGKIKYVYYYGRYFTPYIPVAAIAVGMVWNRFKAGLTYAALIAGALVVLPYDAVMLRGGDDTRSSFDSVTRIAEAVQGEANAVVFDPAALYMLPVKAMAGVDGYFAEDSLEEQLAWLQERYDTVYFVAEAPMDYEVVLRLNEVSSMDDNTSFRARFCPLPSAFKTQAHSYTVYRYGTGTQFSADMLSINANARREAGSVVLSPGGLQYGPYISLQAGAYRVTYSGEGLLEATCKATRDNGKERLIITETEDRTDTRIVYEFVLEEDSENVEFVLSNKSAGIIRVRKITLQEAEED